jgi:hypothetical protein
VEEEGEGGTGGMEMQGHAVEGIGLEIGQSRGAEAHGDGDGNGEEKSIRRERRPLKKWLGIW